MRAGRREPTKDDSTRPWAATPSDSRFEIPDSRRGMIRESGISNPEFGIPRCAGRKVSYGGRLYYSSQSERQSQAGGAGDLSRETKSVS